MAEQLLIPGGRGQHGYLITKAEVDSLWEGLGEQHCIGYLGDLLEKRLHPLTANHSIIHSITEQAEESWEQIQAFYSHIVRFEANPILIQLVKEELDKMTEVHYKNWGHWGHVEKWFSGFVLPSRKHNAEGKKFGVWMRVEDGAITFIGEGAEHINKDADLSTDENIDSLFKFLNNSKPYPTLFSLSE